MIIKWMARLDEPFGCRFVRYVAVKCFATNKRFSKNIALILGYMLGLLWMVYKLFVSPLLPKSCRFYPTCSHYALLCFQSQSKICAISLVMLRLMRCQPFSNGGIDYPVVRFKYIHKASQMILLCPHVSANKQSLSENYVFLNHSLLNRIQYWLVPLKYNRFFMNNWFLLVPHLRSA